MKSILNHLSNNRSIQSTILILFCCFLSDNLFSRVHWKSETFAVRYLELKNRVTLSFKFIDYEFGPLGEHAYLECCDIKFSLNGLHYEKLMRCEVSDQVFDSSSRIKVKDKMSGAKISFSFTDYPAAGTMWADNTNVCVCVRNMQSIAVLILDWYVPSDRKIHDIEISGKWHVNGLYCSDDIVEKRYPVPYSKRENSSVKTFFKTKMDGPIGK